MGFKKRLALGLEKVGIAVDRFDPNKRRLLKHYEIDTVLDVGANTGQFALELMGRFGYTGKIVSFEPMESAYGVLQKAAGGHPDWETVNCALGDAPGTLQINVSENSVSSSFLPILPACEDAEPASKYVSHETVRVDTLDAVFETCCAGSKNIYLKIDTQGFEKNVLDGGASVLPGIDTVELELSLAPLYEGQMLLPEMCALMTGLGYEIVYLESGFTEPESGRVLQVDGIFHRYGRATDES